MKTFIRPLISEGDARPAAFLTAILCVALSGCSDSAPETAAVAQNDSASAAPPSAEMAMPPGDSGDPAMSGMQASTENYGNASGAEGYDETSESMDPAMMQDEYGAGDPGSDPGAAESDPALAGAYPPGTAPGGEGYPGAGGPGAPGYAGDPRMAESGETDPALMDPTAAYASGAPGGPGDPTAGNPDPTASISPGGPGYAGDPRSQPGAAGDPAGAGIPAEYAQRSGAPPGEPGSGDPTLEGATMEGYPGAEGGPGGPGEGGGGAAAAPPADAPEFPAYHLVMGLMQGKYENMKDFVSRRARGDLQKIGAGRLTEAEKAEFKEVFAQPQLAGQPRNTRGGRQIVLRSGEKMITILVKKEGEKWRVAELSIREARRR